MTALGFVLEVVALGAFAAFLISLAVVPMQHLLAARNPSTRADGSLALATLPGFAAVLVMACVSAPSLLHAVGLRADHCEVHDHHLHLCAIHGDALRIWLVMAGAIAGSAFAVRGLAFGRRLAATERLLRGLEQLGRREDGAYRRVQIPGSPWICHAAGALRRRVLVSASLADHLPPEQYAAALSHEDAHLHRRDPLALLVLGLCELLTLPAIAARLRRVFSEASEEAADACAADAHGAPVVAAALVAMARLQNGATQVLPAFGVTDIERRVGILLAGSSPARAPLVWRVAAFSAPALLTVGAVVVDPVHHAIETVLQLVA